MLHVFDEHIKHYGDPDLQFQFDTGGLKLLKRLDVFLWQPRDANPMTTFSTMGMADAAMKDAAFRCELHWTIRGKLSETEESDCASFMANLVNYPFLKNTFVDHWHIITDLVIPSFHQCSNILFHPTFIKDGWDQIQWHTQMIKILNIVPLTNEENELAKSSGVQVMLDHLYQSQIDIFSNRKIAHAKD
ncbi:suppressor of fused domain protein [bacterium]|nr:suppressor of fused domain protein [bacterium]